MLATEELAAKADGVGSTGIAHEELTQDVGGVVDELNGFDDPNVMESREDLETRLGRNAMVLALAQMICADEVVVDEARQSIGTLTSAELHWLTEIQQLAGQCASLRQDAAMLQPAEKAEPGDIAIHKSVDGWDLRVVQSGGGDTVALIRLGNNAEPMRYRPDHLAVARLDGTAAVSALPARAADDRLQGHA